ncbi:MAG: PAS domain S-box protein, partial [Methanosarcina sp.]
MAVENLTESQEEITVLNQLLAVQNVIYVFHTPDKVAEFSSSAIKLAPGIRFCSFCLLGHSKPYGDRNVDVDRFMLEISGITDYKLDDSIHLPEWEYLRVFYIQTRRYFFGYVLITCNDNRSYQKYQPAIINHLNIVAINLENQLQNEMLLMNERFLENEVERRTNELRNEINQHLHSQIELRESHERYRELSDSIPVGVFECDLDGEMIYANKTALGWFGYSESELSGVTIFDCLIIEDHEKARINFVNALNGSFGEDKEYTAKRKNGSKFSIQISSFPIFKDRKVSGLRGTISDITERKNAEIVLLKSELHFRTLFEKAQEGIIYLSPKGEIIRVNDAFKQILGYSADELLNEALFPILQGLGDRDSYGMLLSFHKGQNIHYEIAHPHKDGHSVILDVKASMVEIENEKLIIASFRDITFRKNAEKALKQRSEDLANLVDVSTSLISALEFDDLLQRVVENAVKLYNLDTGAIYLIQGKELFLHSTAPPLPPDSPDRFGMAVIKDHAHIRKALATGEPIAFADSSTERFTPAEQAVIDLKHLISCIFVPILIREKPIGILILSTTEKQKDFVRDEIMIFKMLSTKIGLVIENAMLFRERKKYTEDLEKKNRDQQFLSKLAFDLAVLPANEDPVRFLLQGIWDYTNAVAAILTDYDPVSKCLIPNTILSDKKLLKRILKESGKKIVNIKAKVSDEMYRRMLTEVAITETSLNSITLGAVPKYADKFLKRFTGINFYCGITISMTGRLLGSLAIALKENQGILSQEVMISIGHILSVNLQKRRAENELQIKETRLREIVRNISDVISVIDKEGKITTISENVEKVLGYPVSHYLGKSGLEFVYPEDIPVMDELLKELMQKPGIPISVEVRKISKNSGFKWVRGSAINLLDDPAINGILINFEDVDTIKKSEESLVKFRLGIERSPEAVFMTDPEGIITYINPAFTKIYGYTKEEALGFTPRILKSGTYPEKTYTLFWETLLSRQTIEGELVNKKKDGNLITIEGVNNPILNQKGNIIGFLGIHRDITLRKSREEALRLSEERFRKAFMTNPDAMNINRLKDGMYVDVNEGFTSLTGYSREEVIGKTSFEINIWHDVEDRALLVKALKESAVNKNFELKIRLKNGKVNRCLMSSALIDFNGDKHIISISHDIEEKKLMEDALRESEERFKQVIENADEWIWEVDSKGMYTYSSPIVEKILGYRPQELVGKKHFYDLFPPGDRDLMKRATARVFKEKGRFDKFINKNLNRNGETVFLERSGVPILNKRGKMIGYRGVDSDVTERIISEEKLRKLSLAVEQSPASIVITNTMGEIEYVNN